MKFIGPLITIFIILIFSFAVHSAESGAAKIKKRLAKEGFIIRGKEIVHIETGKRISGKKFNQLIEQEDLSLYEIFDLSNTLFQEKIISERAIKEINRYDVKTSPKAGYKKIRQDDFIEKITKKALPLECRDSIEKKKNPKTDKQCNMFDLNKIIRKLHEIDPSTCNKKDGIYKREAEFAPDKSCSIMSRTCTMALQCSSYIGEPLAVTNVTCNIEHCDSAEECYRNKKPMLGFKDLEQHVIESIKQIFKTEKSNTTIQ